MSAYNSPKHELKGKKIDDRFQFLIEYSKFGFNWERPNIAEANFSATDSTVGIRGSM